MLAAWIDVLTKCLQSQNNVELWENKQKNLLEDILPKFAIYRRIKASRKSMMSLDKKGSVELQPY